LFTLNFLDIISDTYTIAMCVIVDCRLINNIPNGIYMYVYDVSPYPCYSGSLDTAIKPNTKYSFHATGCCMVQRKKVPWKKYLACCY
jgi:hypothetical protein